MSELPNPSPRPAKRRPYLVFYAVIVGYIAFNTIAFFVLNAQRHESESLLTFVIGAFVFEAISSGIWLAMGGGAFVTRFPFVLVSFCIVSTAVGLAANGIERMARIDFIATTLSAGMIVSLSFLVFMIVRRIFGRRIVAQNSRDGADRGGVRFSMSYLLTLTTVVAIALGVVSQLKFKNPEPRQYFGPGFVIYITLIGGLMVSGVVLPTAVVPLFLLQGHASKRAIGFAIGFWFAVTCSASLYWSLAESQTFPEVFLAILLAQLGAALIGASTAVALWLAGYRLERISLKCETSAPLAAGS